MIEFFVPGIPRPQGSKRHVGHGIMVESSRHVKGWREAVYFAACVAVRDRPPSREPLELEATFCFPRPKGHSRKSGLRPDAPRFPVSKTGVGDIDKLLRALLDAMTGVVFEDDCLVVDAKARKAWSEYPGVHVVIREVP